jgi:hypothetical protein
MDTVKQKLAAAAANPEEAIKMDAEIRAGRRSVGARTLVNAVRAARDRGLTLRQIEADAEIVLLKAAYPKLYAMVTDPSHSPAMLNAMLAQLEAIEGGQKTTHDASVHVGTVLVNEFVRPKLGMDQVPLPDSTL